MIFIIRALSQWGKDDEDSDSPTSQDKISDFIKIKEAKEAHQKEKKKREKKKKKKKRKKKMREKERRDNATILCHTCASK